MGTLHEDVEVYDHDIPDRGECRGHGGLGHWLREWGEAWAGWSLEPEEFIDVGDPVIIVAHMRAKGRGSGVEVDRQDALVYELRDGKISRVDYYNRRLLQQQCPSPRSRGAVGVAGRWVDSTHRRV